MDRQVIEYLPEWLRDFKEIKILCSIQQTQAEQLWQKGEAIWKNNFIDTLDESGCKRWEQMLELHQKDTYTLEERRNYIAGRLAEQRPFTYKRLKQMLSVLCGQEGYTIKLIPETYTLVVKVQLTSKNMLADVKKLLDRIVPANLVVDADLMYNVYAFLHPYRYQELKKYTMKQLREDVMR